MKVSFIIPLYNCLPLTQAMLASLHATLPDGLQHEIILTDDVSTDGTRAWLETQQTVYRVLLNERNLGFAATCNRGANAATGDVLVFLNNDLELLPGWLEPMLAGLAQSHRFGVMGNLQIRVHDGTLDHAGLMVTPEGKIAHATSLPAGATPGTVVDAPGVTAACLAIRRADFVEAGRFDEEFRNGGEDVDLCFRLRARGLRCGVATASTVRHHVSAARGPTNLGDERNSRRLARRWAPELIYWGAMTWAREQVALFSGRPFTREGRQALAALPFTLGWTKRPPRFARLLLSSALHREEIRWQRLLDGAPGAPWDAGLYRAEGFHRDEVDANSAWLRRRGTLRLPAGFPTSGLVVSGFLLAAPPDRPHADRPLGFRIVVNRRQTVEFPDLPLGNFNLGVTHPLVLPDVPTRVDIELIGVARSNLLAWAGGLAAWLPAPISWRRRLGRYRRQTINRRLRFVHVVGADEVVFDFKPNPNALPVGPRSSRPTV